MNRFPMLSLALLLSLPLQAKVSNRVGNGNMPRFEDYPAGSAWRGVAAPVKLASPAERMFRTNLTRAAKEPANFAAHYRITQWGCGTDCVAGALIDLKTGDVFSLPLAAGKRGWEHWTFCVSMFQNGGVDYRVDSRLLIIGCGGKLDDNGDNTPDYFYFLWETNRFRLLLEVPGTGKF